jgi:hypothetical protein
MPDPAKKVRIRLDPDQQHFPQVPPLMWKNISSDSMNPDSELTISYPRFESVDYLASQLLNREKGNSMVTNTAHNED